MPSKSEKLSSRRKWHCTAAQSHRRQLNNPEVQTILLSNARYWICQINQKSYQVVASDIVLLYNPTDGNTTILKYRRCHTTPQALARCPKWLATVKTIHLDAQAETIQHQPRGTAKSPSADPVQTTGDQRLRTSQAPVISSKSSESVEVRERKTVPSSWSPTNPETDTNVSTPADRPPTNERGANRSPMADLSTKAQTPVGC
jgi:hypothetical protein